jgi:Holliday junction resolvase RusA-like endonuclease
MRRLVVLGNPVGKGRPRCTGRGAYTPKKTKDAERTISDFWWEAHGSHPSPGLVAVHLTFMEGPGQRAQDIDNLAKLVLDALNGVAGEDDRQVVGLHAELFRGRKEPQTRIIVEEIADGTQDAPTVDGG